MYVPYCLRLILDRYPDIPREQVLGRLRYSTFVSLRHRFLYFEVPKAGCTTMKLLMRRLESAPPLRLFANGAQESRRDMFIHSRENVTLPSLVDLDDKTQQRVLESPEFLRLVVVRNPYTRLLSAWANKVMLCEPNYERVYRAIKGSLPAGHDMEHISFPEFVEFVAKENLQTCDPHWSLQISHIFMGAFNFNLVGKLEKFEECLARFAGHIGTEVNFGLKAENASGANRFGGYERDLAAKVYGLYQADFEKLGYDANDWPQAPTQPVPPREKRLLDEIIERNLLISELYAELYRARYAEAELKKVQRLHLLTVANGVLTAREILDRMRLLRSADGRPDSAWMDCRQR